MSECSEAALKLVAKRSYSAEELKDKLLTKKKYTLKEIEDVIEDFKLRNWINDERYALERTRYRATVSKWGKMRIKQELFQKKVATNYIEAALTKLEAPFEEEGEEHKYLETAIDLLTRKFPPLVKPERESEFEANQENYKKFQKEQKRRLDFLLRRGFSADIAQNALATVTN